MINNSRSGNNRLDEYLFEEAKLLMFINVINKLVKIERGEIIKVIGNHDFDNINGFIQTNPYKDVMITEKAKH
jgi:hypothetical protein